MGVRLREAADGIVCMVECPLANTPPISVLYGNGV